MKLRVLVFRFRGETREWPLLAGLVTDAVNVRWHEEFRTESRRRTNAKENRMGRTAIVERTLEELGLTGGDYVSEEQVKKQRVA